MHLNHHLHDFRRSLYRSIVCYLIYQRISHRKKKLMMSANQFHKHQTNISCAKYHDEEKVDPENDKQFGSSFGCLDALEVCLKTIIEGLFDFSQKIATPKICHPIIQKWAKCLNPQTSELILNFVLCNWHLWSIFQHRHSHHQSKKKQKWKFEIWKDFFFLCYTILVEIFAFCGRLLYESPPRWPGWRLTTDCAFHAGRGYFSIISNTCYMIIKS